jgi:hypothetical protein
MRRLQGGQNFREITGEPEITGFEAGNDLIRVFDESEKWTMPIKNLELALNQFAIEARKRTGSALMIFCQLHKKSDRL